MKTILLVFVMAFLASLASPAYAGWDDDEDGFGVGCEEVQPNPGMQRRCWWNFTGVGTDYSPMLAIRQCENYSIRFFPDIDGVETNGTIEFLVCGDDDIANVPNACFVLEDTTLDGDETSDTESVYGADGTWGVVDIIVACGATANCRVEFACNQ
jgi:hypothetical protein